MEKNEILLKLIEVVKQNPCLYDPKNRSFRDRTKRAEIWQEIAADLHVSSTDAKIDWERLRRQYITRRYKNLPPDTRFDKLMSFMEGCCGIEPAQTRSVMKPQLPTSTLPNAMVPTTVTSSVNANHDNPEMTSNSGALMTSSSTTTTTATANTISSTTSQGDTQQHWLGLLFVELSQKAKNFPIGKQLDIAKQVSKIFEEATQVSGQTAETGEPNEANRSYFT